MYPQQTVIQFANSMIYLLLARFVLNDLPHAAGLLPDSNMPAGSSTIIGGTPEQIEAIKLLIARVEHAVPREALEALTIKFGIPEGMFRPGEKPTAFYRMREKTIYLKLDSTEYDFYHELGHHMDVVAGRSESRHAEADRFAREWGTARKRIVGLLESHENPNTERFLYREELVRRYSKAGEKVYHITTEETWGRAQTDGLHPSVLRSDLQSLTGLEHGLYLFTEPELVDMVAPAIAITMFEENPELSEVTFPVLEITLPEGVLLVEDPEVSAAGVEDIASWITPEHIEASRISYYEGWKATRGEFFD